MTAYASAYVAPDLQAYPDGQPGERALDVRPGLAIVVPMVILWVTLFVDSWKAPQPATAVIFYSVAALAVLLDVRNVPLVLILSFHAPLWLRISRPFVILFAIVTFLGLVKGSLERRWSGISNRVTMLATIFLIQCFASIVISPDRGMSLSYAMQYVESLVFLVVILAFFDSSKDVVVGLKFLAFVAGAALIISFVHAVYRDQMALTRFYQQYSSFVGMEKTAGKLTVAGGVEETTGRWLWASLESNYWAGQLLFPLGVAVGLAGASRQASSRVLWIVIAGMILLGILGTYSRSGFLCVVGMGFVFLARRRSHAVIPLILLSVLGVVAVAMVPFLRERILSIPSNLTEEGGTGRLPLWGRAMGVWITSPLVGRGIGAFEAMQGKVAHNTYMQLLAEMGVVGLGIYLWILAIGIFCWVRVARVAKAMGDSRLRWLAEGCLIGTIGAACLHLGARTAQNAMFVWIFAAFAVRTWANVQRELAEQEELAVLEAPEAEALPVAT